MKKNTEIYKRNLLSFQFVLVLLAPFFMPATMSGTPCVFERVPPPGPSPTSSSWPPKSDPVLMERIRGATMETPFTLEGEADGPLSLIWRRPLQATPLHLRERLRVSRSRSGGEGFEIVCETDWISVAQIDPFSQLNLDSGAPTIWRIEVYEDNRTPTLTVLDEERPFLMLKGKLRGKPIVTPPPIPFFQFGAGGSALPILSDQVHTELPLVPSKQVVPAACAITEIASTSDAIPVTAASIPAGGLNIEGTIYAVSGRTLRLKIDRERAGPTIKILMSAKPLAYGIAPQPVCAIDVAPETLRQSEWITATAPWGMITEFQWRITVNSDGESPTFHYAVFRERRHSMASQNVRSHNPAAYSCAHTETTKQPEADAVRGATFQSAYALTIHTSLQSEGITGDSYRKIVDAILTSVDAWRLICTSCSPYQFSVIAIDDHVYVPANMLHGTPENYRATFIRNYPWNWRMSSEKSSGFFSSVLSFVAVSNSARQRQRFCSQNDEATFSAQKSPLCRKSPPGGEQEMVVSIKWRRQGLGCDSRPNVVACWNGSDQIEMNLKDYSFYVGDTGDVLLGKAARGADLTRVFMHEVGHWLGLGHTSGDGNMMSDQLARARCISDQNVKSINALARGEIERSHGPEALLYE